MALVQMGWPLRMWAVAKITFSTICTLTNWKVQARTRAEFRMSQASRVDARPQLHHVPAQHRVHTVVVHQLGTRPRGVAAPDMVVCVNTGALRSQGGSRNHAKVRCVVLPQSRCVFLRNSLSTFASQSLANGRRVRPLTWMLHQRHSSTNLCAHGDRRVLGSIHSHEFLFRVYGVHCVLDVHSCRRCGSLHKHFWVNVWHAFNEELRRTQRCVFRE
mmetsp:Transcript_23585/g.62123  ORF Transcript_23585/g.62123 Transcript_23585/m.62123 type:complete len:216 (-) Transcript_23585:2147-2794(-)